jgi:predicted TIM-barrel fold metal-dependent hydrolase
VEEYMNNPMATPVIDFRLRPPFRGFLNLAIHDKGSLQHYTRAGVSPAPSFIESDMDCLIQEMDSANIVRGVVLGRNAAQPYGVVANEDIAELVRSYPDRFVPFGSVDSRLGARAGSGITGNRSVAQRMIREVDYCLDDLGFAGIAVDPGWSDPPRHVDSPTFYPLYAHCAEREVPIAITMSIFVGPDISYSEPTALQRVAKDFPSLQVIVAHAAWPWVTELLGVSFTSKNIWVSPDFYGHIKNMPGALHYSEAANYFLEGRLLYASAYPARPLKESVEEFCALPLREDVLKKSLYDNARRLLGDVIPDRRAL